MITQNQVQLVNPIPGDHRMTHISVVKGRKMLPRIGFSQLTPKVALIMVGRAIQMNYVPNRGK